jgi:lipoyl(octanoyl) transferase
MNQNHNNQTNWHKIESLSDYKTTIDFMEKLVEEIALNKYEDTIILTEHKDIITAGTSANPSEIKYDSDIPIFSVGRGGKYTFHGKGQRIIYPIIDLSQHPWNKDLKKYLNFLHNWIIDTLSQFGIKCHARQDHIGVWTCVGNVDAKIAAIGIRARKWIAFHGVAVNLSTDLSKYNSFTPCGISDLSVTSAKNLGYDIDLEEFDEILKKTYYTQKSKLLKNI